MRKWTYSESAQKVANDEIEQLKIFNIPKKPLYHYTSREVFWLIMESETLLARHIMFSNDYEENMIGIKTVNQAMQNAGSQLSEPDALPFMVCFCETEDLLSQWRGYAKEGVALEFDFSKGLYGLKEGFSSYYCYTILNKDFKQENMTECSMTEDVVFMGAVVSPYSVIYTDSGDQVDQTIKDCIRKIMSQPPESMQQYAAGMIPYIKNMNFKEEQEYRLIFDMNQFAPEMYQHLLQQKYIYLDTNGIKKPNIRVKFGDQSKVDEDNTIKLYYVNDNWTNFLRGLKQELLLEKIEIELVMKKSEYKVDMDEVVVSSGKHQETVCARLRLMMRQQTPPIQNMKVWCDGHLPVRKITVGPSQDAELMKCSIKEYLKTKYWMKDIEVEISKIPLRT